MSCAIPRNGPLNIISHKKQKKYLYSALERHKYLESQKKGEQQDQRLIIKPVKPC